ncbi:MAG TPA: M1 family metallopeptidase [Gemmatimonadales bacterium]
MSRAATLIAFLLAAGAPGLHAQRPVPYPVVPPAAYQAAVARGTRTADGAPGPNYWQQWTDYTLFASLDPTGNRIEGRAQMRYHNNAPGPLPVVFLHVLQNIHAAGAVRNEPQEVTGGVQLRRVAAGGQTLAEHALEAGPGYAVEGTIMAIRPPTPVPSGGTLTMEIDWSFVVPESGAGRMGRDRDDFYHVAYWYPQMAVFDDVVGWHVDAYRGGAEFYAGFGSYDLTVEAPDGWVIMATGALQNAREVLPDPIRVRLERAAHSDSVIHVLTPEDFGPGKATRRTDRGRLRWHYVADTVRDAAFAAMRASRWDAARTPVGDRDRDGRMDYARVDAFWRTSAPKWHNTWRYAQHAIDFLSRWTGLSYPWPHMSAIEGGGIIGGGMEFPMMTLIGDYNQRGDSALYYVTAHELAHMWVPMLVGTDEKRYAWMDEGTTTFNENQARMEFFPGLNHDLDDQNTYLGAARAGLEGTMMRWSDYHYPGPAYGVASYSKPASLLVALRGLLGEERFLGIYRTYLLRWRYKHPKPWDFFRTVNAVSGENLDWFWRTWYYETWTLDHAVASVTASNDATIIVVEDRGTAAMPAWVTISRADGTTLVREVPVATWLSGATRAEITIPAGSAVIRVEIDRDGAFPDVDRSNNVWTPAPRGDPEG